MAEDRLRAADAVETAPLPLGAVQAGLLGGAALASDSAVSSPESTAAPVPSDASDREAVDGAAVFVGEASAGEISLGDDAVSDTVCPVPVRSPGQPRHRQQSPSEGLPATSRVLSRIARFGSGRGGATLWSSCSAWSVA